MTSDKKQKIHVPVYPFSPQKIPQYTEGIPPRVIWFASSLLWENVRAGNAGKIAKVKYYPVNHTIVFEGKEFTSTVLYPYYEVELDLEEGKNAFELTYFSYIPETEKYFLIEQ